ncbi:MAG: alpha/beta fold hydrolase [Promethearchaeota archaeon]|jgi:pimeloyl-ACP methyl ester carboxylesterase
MPKFSNDGIEIYYEIEGEGPPVILIHGFLSSLEINWKQTNWIRELKNNYRLILLDCRGHGKSDKPHDESYYGQKMTEDVVRLMEYLSIEKANFFGYSMGASIVFRLLLKYPQLFISAILGGFVMNILHSEEERLKHRESIERRIEGFKVENITQIRDPMARAFRKFAELRGNDLKALAAVLSGFLKDSLELYNSPIQMRETLKKIKVPLMTVVASNELIPGDKTLMAQLVPNACHFQIQGKDHITVRSDPKFHMMVKAFLNYINKK